MNKRRPPKSKGGVLALISLLMVTSALLRLGLEAGPALAKNADAPVSRPETERVDLPGAQELLTELLRREDALKKREALILDKEKALEIANQAIDTRLSALEEAEANLRETLSYAQEAAETDLTRLTDVYQSMKPKDAAALFETMDPGFAAGFLSRMPPDAAAGVLAGLSPEAAYTISVIMAGRNAAAPQE